MTDGEWICWNYETGFSVIDARDEGYAVLLRDVGYDSSTSHNCSYSVFEEEEE